MYTKRDDSLLSCIFFVILLLLRGLYYLGIIVTQHSLWESDERFWSFNLSLYILFLSPLDKYFHFSNLRSNIIKKNRGRWVVTL